MPIRRIAALSIVCIMMLSAISVSAVTVVGEEALTVMAADYTNGYRNATGGNQLNIEAGNVSFNGFDWVEYELMVESDGIYSLTVESGTASDITVDIDVSVNSVKLFVAKFPKGNRLTDYTRATVGELSLTAGINTLRFRHAGTGRGLYFRSFTLQKKSEKPYASSPDIQIYAKDYGSSGEGAGYSTKDGNPPCILGNSVELLDTEWIRFHVTAEDDGYYRFVLKALAAVESRVNVSANSLPQSQLNILNDSAMLYFDNVCLIKLTAGENIIELRVALGKVLIDSVRLWNVSQYTDNSIESFVAAMNGARTAADSHSVLCVYQDLLGMNPDEATEGIFYKNFIYAKMLGNKYQSFEEIYSTFSQAVQDELKSPAVTLYKDGKIIEKLCGGDIEVRIQRRSAAPFPIVIAAVYNNNKLESLGISKDSSSEYITISLKGINAGQESELSFKLLCFEQLENLIIHNMEDNIYKDIYISPNGKDNGTGSKDNPFATFERVKQEIEDVHDGMTGNIIVNVMPGEYFIDNSLVFTNEHGGKNNHHLIIRGADENNKPVISGGMKIDSWSLWQNGIYRTKLENVKSVRNLYVDGYPAVRARSQYLYEVLDLIRLTNDTAVLSGFTVLPNYLPNQFSNVKDLEVVWQMEWACSRSLVENIEYAEDKLTFIMKQPYFSYTTGTPSIDVGPGQKFYIENAIELLDEPGEFCYDSSEKYLYYKPRNGKSPLQSEVYIGLTEGLVKVEGTSDDVVQNIVFENLEFKYGAWQYVSNYGLTSIQADTIVGNNNERQLLHAQFQVNNARGIKIKNCTFACLGSSALAMTDNVADSVVDGSDFRDISGAAISIGNSKHVESTDGKIICKNIRVSNNVMQRVAYEYKSCVAIMAYYTNAIEIVHNDMRDLPYTGISAGWGWGVYDSPYSGNIKISNNYIEDVCKVLSDGSHIYTLGAMPNSEVSYNYTRRSGDWRGGIYTDSGSAYLHIHHNVFAEADSWWITSGSYVHHIYAYNNFSNSDKARIIGAGHIARDNTVVLNENWPKQAVGIMEQAGVEERYSHLLEKSSLPEYAADLTDNKPGNTIPYENVAYAISATDTTKIQAERFQDSINPAANLISIATDYGSSYTTGTGTKQIKYVELKKGSWLKYVVDISQAGEYVLGFVAACYNQGTQISVKRDGNVVISGAVIQKTQNINTYAPNFFGSIYLSAGKHEIIIEELEGMFRLDYITLAKVVHETKSNQTTLIESYRFTDGYVNRRLGSGAIVEGGNVSFLIHDWVDYAINIKEQGVYRISITTGSNSAVTINTLINGISLVTKEIPATGSLSNLVTTKIDEVELGTGTIVLRFYNKGGSAYLKNLKLEKIS